MLEAVAAGQSAALMEQLSTLVNAGHSPISLARQLARYLRNALMAKLGGEQTELLQISADERARAARTALLFSEEELTRNMQIMLRTFDDLNYRQEQRFHLELGLLKLIHAQRLLPVEELLSGLAGSGAPVSGSRPAPSPARSSPPLSPFGFGAARAANAVSRVERRDTPSVASAGGAPVVARSVSAAVVERANGHAEAVAEAAQEVAVEAPVSPAGTIDVEALRAAMGAALAAGGHASAAQLLAGAAIELSGSAARIEVPGVGKKMLALTFNAAAEKIIRQELQRLGAPARFMVVPGEGAAVAVAAAPVLAGSVHEAAMAHPMVRRAQEIFHAEVRSVVDLRQK